MEHGFRSSSRGRGGFGQRGGRFGSRFGFENHHIHPHVFPHGTHHQIPFFDRSVIEETEDSIPENSEEISGETLHPGQCKKGKQPKQDKCTYFQKNTKDAHFQKYKKNNQLKKFNKNSIDLVETTVTNQDEKFTISMDVGKQAKPEDVKVNVGERDIFIEIKMVKWSQDRTSVLSQMFTKNISPQEEVKVKDITSILTPESILQIEAPVAVPEKSH